MNGARDAVLQLEVHLGDGVLGEDGGIADITCREKHKSAIVLHWRKTHGEALVRTDSSRLNHVADGESLDGLVLGSASRAVAAADRVDVAATLLVAAVVLSLLNPFFLFF
jgi:hypothetical protein